jgi:gamma-butyrobetaine dioxygenase
MAMQNQVLQAESLGASIRLSWNDADHAEFPFIWLRDNCLCSECRHPEALERTVDTVELDVEIRPATVNVNGELMVVWKDGHRSVFSADWLLAHAPGRRPSVAAPGPILWTGRSIRDALPEIDLAEIEGGDAGLLRWLSLVRDYGFALVRGVPSHAGAVAELAERIAFVQETNFGRTFQVQSKPDAENLAFTPVKLNAHTDLPNRRGVPGLQFLHCIDFEAEGGESILVDGYMAATRLKEQDPDSHALLSSVAVPYRFQDDHHDIANRFPIIGIDVEGSYTELRFNWALAAPLDLDPQQIRPFYRALKVFGTILRDPELELMIRMRRGDCQVFNNRRVLHGRAAFDPNSGSRHLEGCYIDGDDFMSRLRILEREHRDFR